MTDLLSLISDANKAEGSTDPSLSKKEDSLSLSEKEINDLSETSPTNPAISPSDVSTIASTAKSKSDAGEELNAEGSPTKTSKVNSVAAVFGGITPTAVAIPFNEYGLFSGVPTKTWYKPLGVVSPFATSDVFDKERDATACPECIVFAHPDGFPLEGRPRPCVHSGNYSLIHISFENLLMLSKIGAYIDCLTVICHYVRY